MRLIPLLSVLLLLPAGAALAHTGAGDASGLLHGFAHPLGGADHVLAMVAVGLLAAQLGGRALWAVPAGFVAAMAGGGALGAAGIAPAFVEVAVALSVVVLGGAVALAARLPAAGAAALAAGFAVFHGVAHGAEMPADASGLGYGLGFVAATALLHAVSIGLGLLSARLAAPRGLPLGRLGGAAVCAAGIVLLGAAA